MAVCPICGCKTDEIDFVVRKLHNDSCKVCSFCNRQLNVFDAQAEPTEAQIRWLDAVIAKDVADRENAVLTFLKDTRKKYPEKEIEQPAIQQKINVVQRGSSAKFNDFDDESQVIKDLQKRISALEAEIKNMKRKQMIKTIIELGAPVVLLILFLIVLFSSGILDNFKAIFDMAGIAL